MEAIIAQLKTFPARFMALPVAIKAALIAAVVIGLGMVGVARVMVDGGRRDYVFTSLSPGDSAACAEALTAAGIPFSVEADGAAIAVPHDKVHTARLLLAGQGLPRGAGVGFELFDKGDLGVSEFTQRVNLQRAIEGEMARTIRSLGPVREARVHITLPKKGLFRDEDKGGAAAVMVRLHPGRVLDESAIAGIRHLVASAVPGLPAKAVTIVDEGGALLGEQSGESGLIGYQKKLERSLQERVVAVLEPALGKDSVVARVTAEVDDAEEGATISVFDPDGSVLRSERTRNDERSDRNGQAVGAAGAIANAVANEPGMLPPDERQSQSSRAEVTRTFEVTNTVTTRATRSPRLRRLSVAVVINEGSTPRTASEVARYAELVRKAVGFDEDRGDQLEVTSIPFLQPTTIPPSTTLEEDILAMRTPTLIGLGVLALLVAALSAAMVLQNRRYKAALAARAEEEAKKVALAAADEASRLALGDGGVTVSIGESVAAAAQPPSPPDTPQARAIALALADPRRAAAVLESWLEEDQEQKVRALPAAVVTTTSSEEQHA
jgi:flagellar M-ring protein FliF